MVNTTHTRDEVLSYLEAIPDPEIPVVSIREIGMLRDVMITGDTCKVIITPTYTGCPAMGMIQDDIKKVLHEKGIPNVEVQLVYSPAWTTDWIAKEAREKMRQYGIAPPAHSACNSIFAAKENVACPRCHSRHVTLISQFGATACKALYRCDDCKEPFEYFKCH